MYIVIIGGGRVGYFLARALINEGHETLVVEKSRVVYETIIEDLGSVAYHGDGCEASTLAEVGTGRANMLVAVTGDDEDNLVACQVAKHKFNVPRTIARLRNPQREALFKKLGIDVTVSSTKILLETIQLEVPTHPLVHLLDISHKGMEIVSIRIKPEAKEKMVKEISLPEKSRLALVIPQKGTPHMPSPSTVLRPGDQVIALTPHDLEETLRSALT